MKTKIHVIPIDDAHAAAEMKASQKAVDLFRQAYVEEYAEHLNDVREGSQYEMKQRNTISRQRRTIRRLRRLLKSKDRLLASQKSLYEEMLNEKEKATNGKDVEKLFEEILIRTIRNLENTPTTTPQP